MGTTARTTGAYQSSFSARVLPELLNVVDDPLLTHLRGPAILGAYKVDDEGVPAQSVDVVDHGKLQQLSDRPHAHPRLPHLERPRPRRPRPAAHAHAGVMIFKAVTPGARRRHARPDLTRAGEGAGAATSTRSRPWAASCTRACSTACILTAPASSFAARSSTSSTTAACAPTSSPPATTPTSTTPSGHSRNHHRPQPPVRRYWRKARDRRAAKAALLCAAAVISSSAPTTAPHPADGCSPRSSPPWHGPPAAD